MRVHRMLLSVWMFALIAVLANTSAHAATVVANFDAGVDVTGTVPTYTENGIQFAQYACDNFSSTISFETSPFLGSGKAMHWDPAHCMSDLVVSLVGGGTFDLVSFDSKMDNPYIHVYGCKPDEQAASQHPVVKPCSYGFNPGALAAHNGMNWLGVDHLDFCSYCDLGFNGGGGVIDNFNITVATGVPEPATLALLALGLAGLSFSRRKH